MELVHELTFTAALADPVPVGTGPFGSRRIREVLSGEVTGDRISGTVGTGGADRVHRCRASGERGRALERLGRALLPQLPRLETGDPRYEWVNQTVFVAEGRLHRGPVVEYRVFRVT
jgi:hypothetical protein